MTMPVSGSDSPSQGFIASARCAQQAAAGSAEARLRELEIELPKAPAPVANYVPAVRLGSLIILAGSPPIKPVGKFATGKVGIDVTIYEAYQHARLVGLELLAIMRQELGSLDKVVRVRRIRDGECRTELYRSPEGHQRSKYSATAGGMRAVPSGWLRCPSISASKLRRLSKLHERV
jgi:YjgF/chorismate_mutase-like, putative endoribonuclease